MDPADRHPASPLRSSAPAREELERRAPEASFFALIAHLERTLGDVSIGADARAEDERIRLRHDPSLAFSAGDVARASIDARGRTVVDTTFLGLTGAVGPLPAYLREEVALEDADHGPRRDLLDLFHHRALSLLYRGMRSRRPHATMTADHRDAWSTRLLAFAAAESSELTRGERLAILPLLATRRRSALGCVAAMRLLARKRLGTGTPELELRELAGARTPISDAARLRLGRSGHALGRDSMLGARALDAGSCVVLEVRDVDPGDEVRFRPGGDLHAMFVEVFRLFDAGSIDLEIELHLRRHRAFALGERAPLGRRTRIASRIVTSSVRFAAHATVTSPAR